jgi:hypothetical protein
MQEKKGPYGYYIRPFEESAYLIKSYDEHGNLLVTRRTYKDLNQNARNEFDQYKFRQLHFMRKDNRLLVEYYDDLAQKVFQKNATLTRLEKRDVFSQTKKNFTEMEMKKKKTFEKNHVKPKGGERSYMSKKTTKKYTDLDKYRYYFQRSIGAIEGLSEQQRKYASKRVKELKPKIPKGINPFADY